MIVLFALLAIFALWFYWRMYLPYSKYANHCLLLDKNLISVLLFGRRKDLNSFIAKWFDGLCRKHRSEGMFILWVPTPVLVIFDEDQIKFFSNTASFIDKPKYYKCFKFLDEKVFFLSSGEHYKKHKKVMKPAFCPNVIRNILPVMNHHAKSLVTTLDETNGVVTDQTLEFLRNHTLKIFLESSIGIKPDTEENCVKVKRIDAIFHKLFKITSRRFAMPWLYSNSILNFITVDRETLMLKKELDDILKQELEDIKETIILRKSSNEHNEILSPGSNSRGKSFSEVFIEQHLKDPSFGMKAVKDNVVTILVGGYDTTANTLMWCLWLLGHHEDIQQKAFEEVMAVTNGDIQNEDMPSLTYIECILKETLRMFPAAPMYSRMSSKDIAFGTRTVPKGTPIMFNIYYLHRNPKLYDNPTDFIPERFADGEHNVRPWTYVPFAEGLRACLGKQYAMTEMKIILAHVLRRFKIVSLGRTKDVVLSYEIILKSAKPLCLQFIRRQ